ncbi:MAG TPA: hypothetical protein VN328_06660 [Thermodesulfovibrionales bacterium]|nr:hypothetical protein [Thermodesulfovibrionales bacterium]
MKELLENLPWSAVVFLCLTLGLAPYWPPHLFEKLALLVRGRLVRAVDWFDLFLHSAPWLILMLKALL